MRADPSAKREIVFQSSVACGTVVKLTSKRKQQLSTGIAGDRKSYRVGCPFFRQARTAGCVAQVAKLLQVLRGGLGALVAGCAALAMPSATKRQPGRVQPAATFEFAGRKEKWTRHKYLCCSQFYSARKRIASAAIVGGIAGSVLLS